MKFLKWTALAVCTAAAFAAGAVGAGIAHFYFQYRYSDSEAVAIEVAQTSHRVELLTRLRDGRRDEAKELLEQKLDRDIVRLSGMLEHKPGAVEEWLVGRREKWSARTSGWNGIKEAARYRGEHPRESGNPETDRRVREALAKSASLEP